MTITVRLEFVSRANQILIADLRMVKLRKQPIKRTTSQFIVIGLLICFAIVYPALAQPSGSITEIIQSKREFDNGKYEKAIELAEEAVRKEKKSGNSIGILTGLEIVAYSQTLLFNYGKAELSVEESLKIVSDNNIDNYLKARVYFCASYLSKQQGKTALAIQFSKKALAAEPLNQEIRGEYYLSIGRILSNLGFENSAILWLEKAEQIFEAQKVSSAKLETYRFLSLVWSSRSNYHAALNYSDKFLSAIEKTNFKYKYRQGMFERGTLLSATGQRQKAERMFEKGLNLSLKEEHNFQSSDFLLTIILNGLYEGDADKAAQYLKHLELLDQESQLFSGEKLLIKAILASYSGESEKSEKLFAELARQKNISVFLLTAWKKIVAEKKGNWAAVLKSNQDLFELTERNNYRDDLSGIQLTFASAYFQLKQFEKSKEHLEKSIALIEEIRATNDTNLSLGLFETHHNAYRLLAQIKSDNPQESFELADFLKARLLKDNIDNSVLRNEMDFTPEVRKKLDEISLKFVDDESTSSEIEDFEKQVSSRIPELILEKPDLAELDELPALVDVAVISYFFTIDKKLLAFVREAGKSLKIIDLELSEKEIEDIALNTYQKIKNRIFFKRDGKEIFDKLLRPLNVTAKQLVIVPDKSLWKIPFQALSSDGDRYLIEEKLISYAPSVSILLEQLKSPAPNRQTLQAFANSTYENQFLSNVNAEAYAVAGIYGSKPLLNATSADFKRMSESADIFHFSMHAQIDSEIPLNSFLGFRKTAKNDGRLTVEELLDIKLKKGSLAFLASCDTNNVLNGEGLVSLAWAMMGSGAATVISAQWEANDKSTEMFTRTFYKYYKQGSSSAEAMQKASIDLIRNKSYNFHEPYYWADFTLNGDFR